MQLSNYIITLITLHLGLFTAQRPRRAESACTHRSRSVFRIGSANHRGRQQAVVALLCSMLLAPFASADAVIGVRVEYVFGEGLRLPQPRPVNFAYTEQEDLPVDTEPVADSQRDNFDTRWLSTLTQGVVFVAALGGMLYLARKNSDCKDAGFAGCAVLATLGSSSCWC